MVSAGPRLGQVEPRERVGAQTGRKYEYQYERTARAALDLLTENEKYVCVYCDWHDDYVIEAGDPPTHYLFHQVKGRTSSQGPWKFTDFFGVQFKKSKTPSTKAAKVNGKAIVPRMLLHYANFRESCGGLSFVTNSGIDGTLKDFLEAIARAADIENLPENVRTAFDHVARAYAASAPPLLQSASDLYVWLRSLVVNTDQGQIASADAALFEIADVVFEYSEIELGQRQAKQIAREIIDQVRRKVAHTTTVVPVSDAQLRRNKGIVVTELLRVLSLSTDAYDALRDGIGTDTVKTLSRLQRFCERHNMGHQIVTVSGFKAKWDIWRTIERHNAEGTDFLLLQERAHEVLQGKMTIERVVDEAKDIAEQFAGVGVRPIKPEDVMGLIFSIAAQSEAM